MKIQLPLETWVELLPFVPRWQLVILFFELEDRQLVANLQFFLTEVGQITFDHLRIVAPKRNYALAGPIVEVRKEMPAFYSVDWHVPPPSDLKTILPEGPMPTKVNDFKSIHLSYFDNSVANFLRQFQREQEEGGNSLLDNVNFWFSSHIDNTVMQNVAQILPTIGNINSIHVYHLYYLFGLHDFEGVHNYPKPLKEMLTKTRILDSNDCGSVFSFRYWLYIPRTDGKPRALRFSSSDTVKFVIDILKDFTKATSPVSFFVYVRVNACSSHSQWENGCWNNARTNERLVIKTIDPPPRIWFGVDSSKKMQISRYPMDATKEWIEANEKEIKEWKSDEQNRCIRFEQSLGNDDKMW